MLNDDEYDAAQSRLFGELEAGGISTTVPIRARYIRAATCLSVLAFPPMAIATAIQSRLIDPLQVASPPHHFYSPGDLHVTVKNIRRAQEAAAFTLKDISNVRRVLTESNRRLPAFAFRLKGLLRMPGSIAVRAYATPSYVTVIKMLDEMLSKAAIADDKVYQSTDVYCGNVTVCRFTSPLDDRLLTRIESLRNLDFGEFSISQIHLVECDEVCSESSRLLHATVHIVGPA